MNRSRAINGLPTELKFGNDETVKNFTSHCVLVHRSCHVKYNNQKLAKKEKTAEKRTHSPNESTQMSPKKRQALDVEKCLFCEKGKEEGVFYEVSTFDADHNIRAMITELGETKLMTRMAGGDLIASEAKYHLQCLVKLRNQYRSLSRKLNQNSENADEKMNES